MKNYNYILIIISVILFSQCKSDKTVHEDSNVIISANSDNKAVIVNQNVILIDDHIDQEGIDTLKIATKDTLHGRGEQLSNAVIEALPPDTISNEEVEVKPSPKPTYVEPKPKPTKYIGHIDSVLFDSIVFNFDTITAGEIVKHNFNFINKNINPIEVASTYPDCGCTSPSFPFLPLEKNDKGFIGVTYNSVGKSGIQNATVHVKFHNVKDEVVLTMSGYVKDKPIKKQIDVDKEGMPTKDK